MHSNHSGASQMIPENADKFARVGYETSNDTNFEPRCEQYEPNSDNYEPAKVYRTSFEWDSS